MSVTSVKVLVKEPPTRRPVVMSEIVGMVPNVVVRHGFVSVRVKSVFNDLLL